MRLFYTVDIDEEVYSIDGLLIALDEVVEHETDCNIIRSRIESPAEICENGDWEDTDGEDQ